MNDYINFGIAIQAPKDEAAERVALAKQRLLKDKTDTGAMNAYASALENYAAVTKDKRATDLAAEWRLHAQATKQ